LCYFVPTKVIDSRGVGSGGRVVRPPRASEAKVLQNGRENEYFKLKKKFFIFSGKRIFKIFEPNE
jgi:hypothetical protein